MIDHPPAGTPFPTGRVVGDWFRWFRSVGDAIRALQSGGATGPAGPQGPPGPPGASGVTVETDPTVPSYVKGISAEQIAQWDSPESDPTVPAHVKAMTSGAVQIAEFLATAYANGSIEAAGWEDPAGITVSYDNASRTVTLTHASGILSYIWKGNRYSLASPWVSPAHAVGDGGFFLYATDGVTFAWSTTPWDFRDVLVCFARVDSVGGLTLGIREVHGSVMDADTHDELHNNIGTWIKSGGTLTAGTYVVASPLDADTTPGVDQTVVKDEDLPSTLAALPQGTYQRVRVTAGVAYTSSASFPFTSAGSYLQWYNAGVLTTGVTLRFYNVWGVAVPATADAASQAFRWIWIQPQAEHASLALALAESFSTLDLGNIASLLTEFCPRIQIVYQTSAAFGNTGKCEIEAVKTLTKAKILSI